jgi:hypothetical protein
MNHECTNVQEFDLHGGAVTLSPILVYKRNNSGANAIYSQPQVKLQNHTTVRLPRQYKEGTAQPESQC